MNQDSGEKNGGKPRILVAPLDWGLGHATRCIPLVRELLAQGAEVWLAGEGIQEQLLKTEFPELPFHSLPGYRVEYARSKKGLAWKMIRQGPKLQRAIQYEQRWLEKLTRENHFDGIISDNRYGLYHSSIPCIFITHQLTIKSSWGKWSEKILRERNYKYINRFSECWVPDREGENNLAGELSHPRIKPLVPVRYIGLLSRFEKKEGRESNNHLLVMLSGPEPQRSILEEKIFHDLENYPGMATVLRGLPGNPSLVPSSNNIRVYNHLPAVELNTLLQEAGYVIGRSGYSTVMDLATLEKKSILIPTPGQTEQEYLGEYLMQKGMALCIKQEDFSLTEAVKMAARYPYKSWPTLADGLLKKTIAGFLHQSGKLALG